MGGVMSSVAALAGLFNQHRQLLLLMSANLVSNGTTFAILLLMSSAVSVELFGVLSICISIVMQLSFLLDFGTGFSLVKLYNSHENGARIMSGAFWIRVGTTLILMLFSYPACLLLQRFLLPGVDEVLIWAVLLASVVMSWWGYVRSRLQAMQDFNAYSLYIFMLLAVRILGVAIIYVEDAGNKILNVLLMLYVVAPALASLASWLQMPAPKGELPAFKIKAALAPMRAVLRYGLWVFASAILFTLSNNLPLWKLGADANFGHAAYFGIGVYFANAIAPVREALKSFLFPKMLNFDGPDQVKSYIQSVMTKTYWSVPIAILVCVLALGLLRIVNQDRYDGAEWIVVVMIVTQIVTMFTALIGSTLHYFDNPRYDFYINIGRVVTSLLLSVTLIPLFGAVAAGCIASFTTVAGEVLLVRKAWMVADQRVRMCTA